MGCAEDAARPGRDDRAFLSPRVDGSPAELDRRLPDDPALRSSSSGRVFPRLSMGTGRPVEFGWTPVLDAWSSLNALFRSWDQSGGGTFNAGRCSKARLDSLIDAMCIEPDATRRRAMVAVVLRLVGDELPMVPLYRRTLTSAMAENVSATPWPSDLLELLELRFVRVK